MRPEAREEDGMAAVFEAGAAIRDITPDEHWFEARRGMTAQDPAKDLVQDPVEAVVAKSASIRQGIHT